MHALHFDNNAFGTTKDARFDTKLNSAVKEFLQSAAMLQGVDLSSFVISAATEKARKVIAEAESIALNEKEYIAFTDLLKNPPKATPELKKLMAMERLNER